MSPASPDSFTTPASASSALSLCPQSGHSRGREKSTPVPAGGPHLHLSFIPQVSPNPGRGLVLSLLLLVLVLLGWGLRALQ